MSHTKQSVKMEEMTHVWIPKRRLSRPFPLRWGLLALALFAVFAVITQLQFNRLSGEKIHEARKDTYRSDLTAYNVAVKANEDCLASLELRASYRNIFGGISELFTQSAVLPSELFPESNEAILYRDELLVGVNELLHTPIEENLEPSVASECPQIPQNKPVEP